MLDIIQWLLQLLWLASIMRYYIVKLFCAVLATAVASAFHTFVPNGKEVIYDYRGFFKAGALFPVSSAAECFLHGKLRLQSENNSILVQFFDLKYRLYNGERYHGHELDAEEIPAPEEIADLLQTFKIVYYDNGQAKGIVTEQEEKIYARNMHKAVASMLQLDLKNIDLNENEAHAFITDEYSIHGKISSSYNVVSQGDNLVVKKMQEMATTKPIYQNVISNIEAEYCKAPFEEPISRNSHQMYVITKQEDRHTVKHLESTCGIYVYPFQFKSQGQYVYVNATLNLLNIAPIQKILQMTSENTEEGFTYDIIDPSLEIPVLDLTNGRRTIDMQKQIPIFQSMLKKMVEYLHQNHIHMQRPDIKHGQLVNRMVRLLTVFDQDVLEEIYTSLNAKTSEQDQKYLEIFHQLLPLVGSHASVMLVKKIVHEKKVDDYTAMHMLHTLPSHVRIPTEKMLEATEDMLNWGTEVNMNVRKAAILSFASLIHKTFKMQRNKEQDHVTNLYISRYRRASAKKSEMYDNYVDDFAKKMKSAVNLDIQLLYMQALYNTKLPQVADHLIPIVKRKSETNHDVRLMALWSVAPMVAGNFDKVFKLYWPILTDRSLHLELRMVAYYIIMECRPSASRLLTMFWEMQIEPNAELYHIHYTYLQSMSRTTDPCHEEFKVRAAQFLQFTPKPKQQALSGYYQVDYTDEQYKFGGDFSAMLIATESSRIFKFEMNSQMFNVRSNYYTLFLKIDGLKETIDTKFHLNLNDTSRLFNYDEIWNLINSISDMKDVHIQVAVTNNHQIIQSYYYDLNNFKDLNSIFEFFQSSHYSKIKNSIEIHYDMFTQIVIPTEIGIPAVVEVLVPTVHHRHININKNASDNFININLDNKYHMVRHFRYGISLYNPIVDVWQGSNRYHSYDFVLPLYADITINTQEQSLRISMKRHQDRQDDFVGLRSHVTTLVFVNDDLQHDVLKKSCSICRNWTTVSKGDEFRHNYTIYHKEDYNTGYNYKIGLYDSEVSASTGSLHNLFSQLTTKRSKNYHTPIEYLALFLHHWHMLVMLQPTPSTHGIVLEAVPNNEIPVNQIDLTFDYNKEIIQQKDEYLPGMKFNIRTVYSLKNKEKIIQTWNISGTVDISVGHAFGNLQLDVTRIIPGQNDLKICVCSTKKWATKGVNGHTNIVMGKSTDGKCNTDGASIDITMVGEQLEDQKIPYHTYEICQPYSHNLGLDYHSMYCSAAHTSVRKYTYDVMTKNVSPEFHNTFLYGFDNFKKFYQSYYTIKYEQNQNVTENSIKVGVEYPTSGYEMNVILDARGQTHEFSAIPSNDLSYWGFYPDNIHFSKLYMIMHHMGVINTCIVHHSLVQHGLNQQKQIISYQLPDQWTMFVGDMANNSQHAVFVKKVEGTNMVALKFVHETHTLEVYPDGKHKRHFRIMVDGEEVSNAVDYHARDWFTCMIRPHIHGVIVTIFRFQIHVEFTGKQVVIEIPKVDGVRLYGHCIMNYST